MQRVRCLLFYLVSNIVVGLMVYAVPEGRGHAHRVDALVTMVVFQVLCCLVLLSLQGSDPGYVSKGERQAGRPTGGAMRLGGGLAGSDGVKPPCSVGCLPGCSDGGGADRAGRPADR